MKTRESYKLYMLDSRLELANIFSLNLMAYLGANVVKFDDIDSLVLALKISPPSGICVNFSSKNSISSYEAKISAALKELDSTPQVVFTGVDKKREKDFIYLSSSTKIKPVIQNFASTKGITAKDMASLEFGDFYPISKKFFCSGWKVSEDLFIKSPDGYLKIIGKDEKISKEVLDLTNEDSYFYVNSKSRLNLIDHLTLSLQKRLAQNIDTEERIRLTNTAFIITSENYEMLGISKRSHELALESVSSMEKVVEGSTRLKKLYRFLTSEKSSIRYIHAQLSAYLGIHILNYVPWSTDFHKEQWPFLCFFHDVVLTEDHWTLFKNNEEIESNVLLSPRDKTIIKNHAKLAANLVSQIDGIPDGVATLIRQHHGQKYGNEMGVISRNVPKLAILFVLLEEWINTILINDQFPTTKDLDAFILEMYRSFPNPRFHKMIPALYNIELK